MRLEVFDFKECPDNIKDTVANSLFGLWKETYEKNNIENVEDLKAFLKNSDCFVFCDVSNGEFVATFTITENVRNFNHGMNIGDPQRDYWLSNVFVVEKHRHKNVGTYVLKYAEEYVNTLDASSISLVCDGNVCTFYKRNGYKSIGFVNENKQSYVMINPLMKS